MALMYPLYHGDEESRWSVEVLRTWSGVGELFSLGVHVVELVRLTHAPSSEAEGEDSKEYSGLELLCTCDSLARISKREDCQIISYPDGYDPHTCVTKTFVRKVVQEEARRVLQPILVSEGMEAAVLSAYERVKSGGFLGQHTMDFIFVQEVAGILDVSKDEVLAAVKKLYGKEKLDLNGMILCEYIPGFRFPDEIRMMIRLMVETPLGWPNGDAGDTAVATLEKAVADSGAYPHGKDLVWQHNFPGISGAHLLHFAQIFCLIVAHDRIPNAVDAARRGEDARMMQWFREHLPANIEQLEKALDALRKAVTVLAAARIPEDSPDD